MTLAGTAGGRALLGPARRLGTLPWLIAATAFLAVLAFAAALALAAAAGTLAGAGADRYTIELVDADPARQEAHAAQLVAALRRSPNVAAADRVPAAEVARLAAPMLGEADASRLPLPVLIDVTLAPAADPAAVTALVSRTPGAGLIDGARTLAPLAGFVRTLRGLAAAVAALAGGVTLLVAVLAARTMLAAHATTIATLHALGATDRDVAALVQRRTGRDALLGAGIGAAAALLAIRIVALRYAALGGLGHPAPAMPPSAWLLLALVPLALAGAATLAARVAVLATLAREP